MPTYEYRCQKCGQVFDQKRPMAEAGNAGTCPACGGQGEKLPSVFASKDGYQLRVPGKGAYRG